jgi:hypothetical protein
MPDIRVQIDELVPDIVKLIQAGAGTTQILSNTLATLNALTYAYQAQWKAFALGEAMPGIPRIIKSGAAYAQSIQVDVTDDFIKTVFTDSKSGKYIEEGHGEIDLKPGLLAGKKVRYTKSGTPYNIVAFRHGTPKSLSNPMPVNIYQLSKKLFDDADATKARGFAGWAATRKAGTSRVISTDPRKYEWGVNTGKSFGGPATTVKTTSKGDYVHKFSKFANMVRMQVSTEHAKRSEYITFRVVSIHSDPASWIVPAIEGAPIRQAVVEKMRDETVNLLREAVIRDLGASA